MVKESHTALLENMPRVSLTQFRKQENIAVENQPEMFLVLTGLEAGAHRHIDQSSGLLLHRTVHCVLRSLPFSLVSEKPIVSLP